ncbi:MAG: hypothetical protein H0Z33_11440 [Bacillaceae bacterium]|nr:hypothetical protein [Bacillaceae bacterium]
MKVTAVTLDPSGRIGGNVNWTFADETDGERFERRAVFQSGDGTYPLYLSAQHQVVVEID